MSRYLTSDVVDKIQEIQLDETERGSLKAIILLNPDSRGLHYPETVLQIREKLYASLEAYCKVSKNIFCFGYKGVGPKKFDITKL